MRAVVVFALVWQDNASNEEKSMLLAFCCGDTRAHEIDSNRKGSPCLICHSVILTQKI